MNVSAVVTKEYENFPLHGRAENKPNQTQLFSNGLNNRKSNLRLCTNKENVRNSRPSLRKTSRYKGVYRDKREKKFIARIEVDGEKYCLGYFNDEIAAAIAYDIKAMVFFGEFAYLNFPWLMQRYRRQMTEDRGQMTEDRRPRREPGLHLVQQMREAGWTGPYCISAGLLLKLALAAITIIASGVRFTKT